MDQLEKTKKKIKRNRFTEEEDNKLRDLHQQYGSNWELIAELMPGRNERQCRERFNKYLEKQVSFTPEEDTLLSNLFEKFHNYKKIVKYFHGRTAYQLAMHHKALKSSKNVYLQETSVVPWAFIDFKKLPENLFFFEELFQD